jgi:hypothetical protein
MYLVTGYIYLQPVVTEKDPSAVNRITVGKCKGKGKVVPVL